MDDLIPPDHPYLTAWHTRLHGQPSRDDIEQTLLERVTWAITVARLTPRSYRHAADRALAVALRQAADEPIVEIDIACIDPALLPVIEPHPSGTEIVYSYLDEEPTRWPTTDVDLVEVTVMVDGTAADPPIGRAWAAPDWLAAVQVCHYDRLRSEQMTPPQALARVRRLPGRSVQTGRVRRRSVHRRIGLRYPRPHPALAHWLQTVGPDPSADHELLAQLRWATGLTGCLTRESYADAVHRATTAARSGGERGGQMTARAARTDLLTHRYPIAVIEAARDPAPIDRVTIRSSGTGKPFGVAWAVPVGVPQHQYSSYEAYRAAGVGMREAYRRVVS